jgi:hypothetical protein
MSHSTFLRLAAVLLLIGLVTAALAAPAPTPAPVISIGPRASDCDNSALKLGIFWGDFATRVRVDKSGTAGTDLSLENNLGLKKNRPLLLADFTWRASRKWNWDFEYSNVDRTADAKANVPVTYNGTSFDITEQVTTHFETQLFSLRWRYSFYDRPETRIGAALGVGGFYLQSKILGVDQNGNSVHPSVSAPVPIPELGLKVTQRVFGKTFFEAYYNYFFLNYKGVSGRASDLNAGLEYLFDRHFGLNASYLYKTWNISANDVSDFSGKLNYTVKGPALTANYYF